MSIQSYLHCIFFIKNNSDSGGPGQPVSQIKSLKPLYRYFHNLILKMCVALTTLRKMSSFLTKLMALMWLSNGLDGCGNAAERAEELHPASRKKSLSSLDPCLLDICSRENQLPPVLASTYLYEQVTHEKCAQPYPG